MPSLTHEIVIDDATGKPRQAGTTNEFGHFIQKVKAMAEQSLYFFCTQILGFNLFTKSLHGDVCSCFQNRVYRRKLFLLPRDHYKTTIAKGFAIHLCIQPEANNIYFNTDEGISGLGHSDGRSTRILFASKTSELAETTLGSMTILIEQNRKLKAFWPECFWDDPRRAVRDGRCEAWNNKKIFLPRSYSARSEATIDTIGVGGTRTGFHYDVHILDDLIDIKDRNSAAEMKTAIEWHTASRAFLQDQELSYEFTIGTKWAVHDLYQEIIDNDGTVEPYIRSIVEEGVPIFPERFSLQLIERMKRPPPEGFGLLFPLLYMNNAYDPELVDFQDDDLRYFTMDGGAFIFDEDLRDDRLREHYTGAQTQSLRTQKDEYYGKRLTPELQRRLFKGGPEGRDEFLRMRYS